MSSCEPAQLEAALRAWDDAVGPEHVYRSPEARARYEAATYATGARVLAVVRPGTVDEVRAVVCAAGEHGVPIYPISRGRNWGYGSRAPVSDACVVDLGRMNRVLELDEELGYAVVEPGVTFEQLAATLRARAPSRLAGWTGGPRDGSVLGNALERGIVSGPYGEAIQFAGPIEVVLSTGELLRTGFSRFEGVAVRDFHRSGVGPDLFGLFTQSGFGVVTRMTIRLAPAPAWSRRLRVALARRSELGGVMEVLRPLQQAGLISGAPAFWNDYKVAALGGRRPPVDGALPRSRLGEVSGGEPPPEWLGGVEIHASGSVEGWARVARVRLALWPTDASVWLAPVRPSDDGGAALPTAYWRKAGSVPADVDLDRDRCGLLWLCPTIPCRAEAIDRCVDVMEGVCLEHGFEPALSASCSDGRVAHLLCGIHFDRDRAGADDAAMECWRAGLDALSGCGFPQYRLGAHAMGQLPPANDDSAEILRRLGRALDPHGVISPGRYAPPKPASKITS